VSLLTVIRELCTAVNVGFCQEDERAGLGDDPYAGGGAGIGEGRVCLEKQEPKGFPL
jgi:hypothetical protein